MSANGGHEDISFDALAYRYAQKLGKPMTAGTDIHDASMIYNEDIFGVYLDKKLESIADYVHIILNNQITGLKTDMSRFEFHGTERVNLPVDVRDERDKVIGHSWKEVM